MSDKYSATNKISIFLTFYFYTKMFLIKYFLIILLVLVARQMPILSIGSSFTGNLLNKQKWGTHDIGEKFPFTLPRMPRKNETSCDRDFFL